MCYGSVELTLSSGGILGIGQDFSERMDMKCLCEGEMLGSGVALMSVSVGDEDEEVSMSLSG